jgi:hypothetical protein
MIQQEKITGPSEEDRDNDYSGQKKLYDTLEPYHYFGIYIDVNKKYLESPEGLSKLFGRGVEFLAQRDFTLVSNATFNKYDNKIIEIEDNLMSLLQDTTPSYEDLRMPWPSMFINKQFRIGDFIINGFLLIDVTQIENASENKYEETIRVLAVILNTAGRYEFYSTEPLRKWQKDEFRKHYYDNPKEGKDMRAASRLINTISANLLNILVNNEEDIVQVPFTASAEQNKKRAKRGKMPHSDKLFIRLSGETKRYAKFYAGQRGKISVRFMVRGHWRHFKSDRYKAKKGTKRWIYPFYRGEHLPEEFKRFVKLKIGDGK